MTHTFRTLQAAIRAGDAELIYVSPAGPSQVDRSLVRVGRSYFSADDFAHDPPAYEWQPWEVKNLNRLLHERNPLRPVCDERSPLRPVCDERSPLRPVCDERSPDGEECVKNDKHLGLCEAISWTTWCGPCGSYQCETGMYQHEERARA